MDDDQDAESADGSKLPDSFSSEFNAPDADLLLRSTDGVLLAVEALYLMAASKVLKRLVKEAQPAVDVQGVARLGQASSKVLPFIQTAVDAEALTEFVRWTHIDHVADVMDGHDGHSLYSTGMMDVAKVYMAHGVLAHAFAALHGLVEISPENALGLGALYGDRDYTGKALRKWLLSVQAWEQRPVQRGPPYPVSLLPTVPRQASPTAQHQAIRPCSISNIWGDLSDQLPSGFFLWIALYEQSARCDRAFDLDKACDTFEEGCDHGFPTCMPSFPPGSDLM